MRLSVPCAQAPAMPPGGKSLPRNPKNFLLGFPRNSQEVRKEFHGIPGLPPPDSQGIPRRSPEVPPVMAQAITLFVVASLKNAFWLLHVLVCHTRPLVSKPESEPGSKPESKPGSKPQRGGEFLILID